MCPIGCGRWSHPVVPPQTPDRDRLSLLEADIRRCLEAHRLAAGRSGRDQNPQPALRLRRQPAFRNPVPDHEIPPGLPGPLRLGPGFAGLRAPLLPLVQRRSPACVSRPDAPPGMVHYDLAPQAREQRQRILDAAYQAHPERFVRQPPQAPPLQQEVWINKPPQSEKERH